jgi:hypothetical protein
MAYVKLPMKIVAGFYAYCGAVGGFAALVLSTSAETHAKIACYAADLNDLSGRG